jgi:hyperosmotically inducible protein
MKIQFLMPIGLLALLFVTPYTAFAQDSDFLAPTSVQSQGPEDDAMITKSITEKIKSSEVLSKLPVNVSTSKGVVTLTGNVDSDGEASMLIQLSESIIGVSDVDASKLVIKDSKQYFSDMAITAKIRGLLLKEKVFGTKDVAAINLNIDTNNGIVYLSGDVDNNDQIKNAIEIIKKNVPDIKGIEYKVRKITANQ